MNDERSPGASDDDEVGGADVDAGLDTTDVEAADGGLLDQFDDPVLAADDTGMLAGERMITIAELEQGNPTP